ncbi:hypothetical protein [Glycomyces sp. NPDC048151]|uniref:hypothetical protein n=1 Tax=Glycomyces sp. NPDC048151 TaxID=3364002 RepID=UPI00372056FC
MSDDIGTAKLRDCADRFADGLCERLEGAWHRTDQAQTVVSITDGERELWLWGFEHAGKVRLRVQAQLPDGWTLLEEPPERPEITASSSRSVEAVTTEITRRLLPAQAEAAVATKALLDRDAERNAARDKVLNHFLAQLPASERNLYSPYGSANSHGPGPFTAEIHPSQDGQAADLRLRYVPAPLVQRIVSLIGSELRDGDDPASSAGVLDDLANAITALASARKTIELKHLLRETALNVLILSRIASNRLPDRMRREEIESATDHLITQLRHASWELPVHSTSDLPQPEQS